MLGLYSPLASLVEGRAVNEHCDLNQLSRCNNDTQSALKDNNDGDDNDDKDDKKHQHIGMLPSCASTHTLSNHSGQRQPQVCFHQPRAAPPSLLLAPVRVS